MRIRVIPYKQGSQSAKALSAAIGGKLLRLANSTFVAREDDFIVNWGSTREYPNLRAATLLNPPEAVAVAANKLDFFELMRESESQFTPKFWTDRGDIPESAYPIVCRTILNGHSGAGIVIANDESELVDAPLYVNYVKKTDEYRIHVGSGQIIAVQRKGRRRDVPNDEVNWRIRNHANGFVYVRQNVSAPPSVTSAAIKALLVSGLDFGAVDVIYHENRSGVARAKVLEINTAPGMQGQTVQDYARYFETRRENG